MKQKNSWGFIFWIALFVILLSFMQASRKKGNQEDIPYSTFKQSVKEGKVVNVVVSPTLIEGEITAADGKVKKFKTIPLDDPKLVEDMENNKVQQFAGKSQNGWIQNWYVLFLLICQNHFKHFCSQQLIPIKSQSIKVRPLNSSVTT